MQLFRRVSFIATIFVSVLIALPAQASVVIQEVLYDGPGTDADDVFTELFGTPGLDLTGWSLVGINGGDGQAYQTVTLDGQFIPADGLFVIATAAANSTLAAQRDFIANVDWQNGPDALQLRFGGEIMDALQYGDAGIYNAGEGNYAADVTGTISLSRDLFGTDTNDNAIDFSAGDPTPGTGPSVVPIPAAAWMFASGLGLLPVLRRRNYLWGQSKNS
jgi:predicted extracellular nuclease